MFNLSIKSTERFKFKTWFTADTHFDHANIIKYCGRPFKSVQIMNDTLVRNWNSRVKENDIVIFLGDFAFKGESPDKWLSLLNGHITFVRGNHDKNNSLNTRIISLIINLANRYWFCIHNPEKFNQDFKYNLVGHVHEKWRIKKKKKSYLVNTGVDVWNFHPVDINEILKALEEFKRDEKKV